MNIGSDKVLQRQNRRSDSRPPHRMLGQVIRTVEGVIPAHQPWASLTASPARLRVSQGRTALRSVAHSAMRPHRGVAPGIPVCPPREHVPPWPLRRIALWSVLRGKTIPPLHPSPASGRAVCLLGSGKPTVKTHTHERGSISSGWPPNQPASRIAKLFGEGAARGAGRSHA